jgi:hypothetical protein
MYRFEILANSVLVGHTKFEGGDPPMGVVFGVFHPTDAYDTVRESILRDEGRDLKEVQLLVRVATTGQEIESQGGVHITDHSAELGPDGREITALGIGYPLYAELFPEHVDAYDKQFK